MIYICAGFFVGWFVDKCGFKGIVLVFGFSLLAVSQYMFYILPPCISSHKAIASATYPIIALGFANTFIHLSLYPTVNYIVKEDYFGTAYGLLESATNVGYLIGSLTLGNILNINLGPEAEATDLE
jgi:predicted MFS family arabinose efflux permease